MVLAVVCIERIERHAQLLDQDKFPLLLLCNDTLCMMLSQTSRDIESTSPVRSLHALLGCQCSACSW